MKITLRFFASLRESLGATAELTVAQGCTVGEAREQLIAQGGAQANALARDRALRCALNQTLCDESAVLSEGDELAFFPPVTGG